MTTPTTETGIVGVTLDMIRAGGAAFTLRFAEQCGGEHPSTAVCEAAAIAVYGAMVRASPRAAMPDSTQLLQTMAGALEQLVAEKRDYMLINKLGNPDEQHTIKVASAALAQFRAQEQRS